MHGSSVMTRTRLLRIYSTDRPSAELRVECPRHTEAVPLEHCLKCDESHGLQLVGDSEIFLECKLEAAGGKRDRRSASRVPLADVMTRQVVSVPPETPIEAVVWLLLRRGFGGAPVVDEERGLVGIITATDLLRAQTMADEPTDWGPTTIDGHEVLMDAPEVSVRTLSGLNAQDVMTPVVHTLPESAPIAVAAALMVDGRVHRIPIVSGEDPTVVVGMVSSIDLMRWLARNAGYMTLERPSGGGGDER